MRRSKDASRSCARQAAKNVEERRFAATRRADMLTTRPAQRQTHVGQAGTSTYPPVNLATFFAAMMAALVDCSWLMVPGSASVFESLKFPVRARAAIKADHNGLMAPPDAEQPPPQPADAGRVPFWGRACGRPSPNALQHSTARHAPLAGRRRTVWRRSKAFTLPLIRIAGHFRRQLLHAADEFVAVHIGHDQVAQNQIDAPSRNSSNAASLPVAVSTR